MITMVYKIIFGNNNAYDIVLGGLKTRSGGGGEESEVGQIVAIAMQKGGSAKTTTALTLGVELASRGKKVLLVDLDHQANLTIGIGIDPYSTSVCGAYETLYNAKKGFTYAVDETEYEGLDVIPSNNKLAVNERQLQGLTGSDLLLRKAFEVGGASEKYDWILLDCPPSLGLYTVNALVAADSVLVPLQVEVYAFHGLRALEEIVRDVKEMVNKKLEIKGIVCTLVDARYSLAKEIMQEARDTYGDLVFDTAIPRNSKMAESPSHRKPIQIYAPHSAAAKAYEQLTIEFEERYGRA